MKTNFQDMTKNIPDDLKSETSREQVLDYIARAAADGEEGRASLVRSIASSIGLNLHLALARMIQEEKAGPMGAMISALDDEMGGLAIVAGLHAHVMALAKMALQDAAPHGDAAMQHTAMFSKTAFNIGKSCADDVADSLRGLLNATEIGTTKTPTGTIFAFDKKPPTKKDSN